MTYRPGDEVQWQDPWMVAEVGEAEAPWHAGTVVEGTEPGLVAIDLGHGATVELAPEYVRSAPRLPLEGM